MLDVRILTPLDLAVSKLGRSPERDRTDVAAQARRCLVNATNLGRRARESLEICVVDTQRLRGNIASAVVIVAANGPLA